MFHKDMLQCNSSSIIHSQLWYNNEKFCIALKAIIHEYPHVHLSNQSTTPACCISLATSAYHLINHSPWQLSTYTFLLHTSSILLSIHHEYVHHFHNCHLPPFEPGCQRPERKSLQATTFKHERVVVDCLQWGCILHCNCFLNCTRTQAREKSEG